MLHHRSFTSVSRPLVGLLLALMASFATALPPASVKPTLDRIISTSSLGTARVGVSVKALEDGEVWYSRNADALFAPASTTKIVTSAVALNYLGPDYRYVTSLLADGEITDGVLHGDLYLRGGGDPSLTVTDLRQLMHSLALGDAAREVPPVREVRGRLVLDESAFPRSGPLLGTGWAAGNLPWYFAAPSNAFSLHRNAVTVTVRGTASGKAAAVTLIPPTKVFTIRHSAVTRKGAKTTASITRQGSTLLIRGVLAPGKSVTERISVPDPPRLVAEQARLALQAEGIVVGEDARGVADPARATMLATRQSAPLSELLIPMMKSSDNHMAEQFRWTVLAQAKQEVPLTQRYPAILADFLSPFGLLTSAVRLVDGSGLSRDDRISPNSLTGVLMGIHTAGYAEEFKRALCIAGVDGTLRARMTKSAATGKVLAKTGTVNGASALAGYVEPVDGGRRLAFTIFVNGAVSAKTARNMQDRITNYLADVAATAPVETTTASQ